MAGEREQNYWPGFVDALSNVVLTLVFVLVIFVFALVMVSSDVEERIREELELQKVQINQSMKSDITASEKKFEESKNENGMVAVDNSENSIAVHFPSTVTDMDQKSSEQLGQVYTSMQKAIGKHKVIMRSYIGEGAYSTAQRLAYYRAMGVRNHLISKLGEPPGNIKMSIVNPSNPEEGGHVEIIFQKE